MPVDGYQFTDATGLPWRKSKFAVGVEVKDLGSANGILINDEALEHAQLNDGDRLHIGGFQFIVRFPEPKEST